MNKKVVMVCTAARGGMRAVVEGYRADGVFARWDVELLVSHVEGSVTARLKVALFSMARLAWLLLSQQVALVHCHAAMRGSFWRKAVFALMARLARVPVVFHLHGSEMKVFVDKQPPVLQRLIAWVLAQQSLVLVLSQSWQDYLHQISPNAKVQTLPNYVVLPDLSARNNAPRNEVNVLFLGLVGTRKGVFDLLPAMKVVLSAAPTVRLTLGGNGELDRAGAAIAELGIGHAVTLAGWVGAELKQSLLSSADIYVLPSHNEGLPVSLLEAMSWAVPVISTHAGGIPELVRDGQDGVLVTAGDENGLAQAISRLATSADLRHNMGQAARARVEACFSRDVVLPRLERVYQALMKP